MRHQIRLLIGIALSLIVIDLAVAGVLRVFETRGMAGGLVTYFEYGRSVPGKLARWEANPDLPGNLRDVAWPADILEKSAAGFAAEDPGIPVVRNYGMSFSAHILRAAQDARPDLVIDQHNGPGAPPNFAYATALDDGANRRPGDIAVFAILSSSLSGMASFSNRSWAFEQPAPFTYPIFRPEGATGLTRIDPIARGPGDAGPEITAQFAAEDAHYSAAAFALPAADASPFARLVRRALAVRGMQDRRAELTTGGAYPVAEVLQRMVLGFAAEVRAQDQVPVVFLIQSNRPQDLDVAAMLRDLLEAEGIPYLATADIHNPRNPVGYLGDGHFTKAVNARLAEAFLTLPQVQAALEQ